MIRYQIRKRPDGDYDLWTKDGFFGSWRRRHAGNTYGLEWRHVGHTFIQLENVVDYLKTGNVIVEGTIP